MTPYVRRLLPLRQDELGGRPLDERIARVAARQHGVVSTAQLQAVGLGSTGIGARAARGALHRLHRGVYAVGHPVTSRQGRLMAAVLATGQRSAVSHRTAGDVRGIRPTASARIEVTRPSSGSARDGIVVHRGDLRADEVTLVGGIPVTTVPRTLVDLAEVLAPAALRRAVREADHRGLFDRTSFETACRRAFGRHGVPELVRQAAPELAREEVGSPLEDRLLDLVEAGGLPRPAMDVHLEGRERDAVWAQQRLVVELDSRAFHRSVAAFEDDRARDAHLLALGWRTLRLTDRRLRHDAAAVVCELRALLRST